MLSLSAHREVWLECHVGFYFIRRDRASDVLGLPARFNQFAVSLLTGLMFECEKPHADMSQGQLAHHPREKTQ